LEVCAGPDAGGEVGEDGLGGAALDLAEGVALASLVGFCLLGVMGGVLGRPAEEGVGVEVAHYGADDVVAGLGVARAGLGFLVFDVIGAGG